MNDELITDTARMFANDIMNDTETITYLENGRIAYNGDEMTIAEFVEELREWEDRGACTTDYFSGSGKLWGDEYYVEDEYGDTVQVDLAPIVDEYFRILSTEWVGK
jgi:hypothetical protein